MESGVNIGSQVRPEIPCPQEDLTLLAQHQVCGTDFRSICRTCVCVYVYNFCLLATKQPFLRERDHHSLQNYEKQYRDDELPVFCLSPERNCMYLLKVFVYKVLTRISFCCAATFHRCNK